MTGDNGEDRKEGPESVRRDRQEPPRDTAAAYRLANVAAVAAWLEMAA